MPGFRKLFKWLNLKGIFLKPHGKHRARKLRCKGVRHLSSQVTDLAENWLTPILKAMPTVLRILGFRFHFYSDEGTEPAHIHVEAGDAECKFWLSPVVLAKNRGMKAVDIRRVERLIFENQAFLLEKYSDFQSQ